MCGFSTIYFPCSSILGGTNLGLRIRVMIRVSVVLSCYHVTYGQGKFRVRIRGRVWVVNMCGVIIMVRVNTTQNLNLNP